MRALAFGSLLFLSLAGVGCSASDDDSGGGVASNDPNVTGCTGANCVPGASSGAANEPAPTHTDAKKNGDETGIDCGGPTAPKCGDGLGCAAASDCESAVCTSGKCQPASGTDGVKNGDETDLDCGGTKTGAPKCVAGKACNVHEDCASNGCGYDKKCALAASCAAHFGGDTCGEGEVGDPGAKHESCCTSLPIDTLPGPKLDKYLVTAGRMRQFIERTQGDVKSLMEKIGPGNPSWDASWNDMLPTNLDDAHYLLGENGQVTMPARAGCDMPSGGRTYWMSKQDLQDIGEDGEFAFPQDTLDQKALNCVDFYMLQALCIWDGGRLAKNAEIVAAWTAGENRVYPWGGAEMDLPDQSLTNWKYSYAFPEVYDKGNVVYVGAPGRFPGGYGKFGHADLAGLLMELTFDMTTVNGVVNDSWTGAGSWEGHGILTHAKAYGAVQAGRAYWAAGGRCAHD